VAALEFTSDIIIRVFRLPQGGDSSVTEADVSAMVAADTAAGVFDPVERRTVERVFRLDDEPVAAMMTPRTDIVWLDINDSLDVHYDLIRQHPYWRFPVCDGGLDRFLGITYVGDIWIAQREAAVGAPLDPAIVDSSAAVCSGALARTLRPRAIQSTGTQIAIIIDEHGGVDGS
jgi:putative hemolysin